MTDEQMTVIKQVAAEALFRYSESKGGYHPAHWTVDDFSEDASLIVESVREHIEIRAIRKWDQSLREAHGDTGVQVTPGELEERADVLQDDLDRRQAVERNKERNE